MTQFIRLHLEYFVRNTLRWSSLFCGRLLLKRGGGFVIAVHLFVICAFYIKIQLFYLYVFTTVFTF